MLLKGSEKRISIFIRASCVGHHEIAEQIEGTFTIKQRAKKVAGGAKMFVNNFISFVVNKL